MSFHFVGPIMVPFETNCSSHVIKWFTKFWSLESQLFVHLLEKKIGSQKAAPAESIYFIIKKWSVIKLKTHLIKTPFRFIITEVLLIVSLCLY